MTHPHPHSSDDDRRLGERRHIGTFDLTPLPAWAKALIVVVGMLGFPIVVAGFLLMRDAGMVGSPLLDQSRMNAVALAAHVEKSAEREAALRGEIAILRERLDRSIRLQAQICRNTAKNDYAASLCDGAT